MTARAWLALGAAIATASCGAPLMKLPSGAGAPAADAAEAFQQATAVCQGVDTLSAEVAVSGTVGGRRTRARILAGLSAPSSAYLEAPAPFGGPIFIFGAVGDDATLVLPRDRRVLEHGHAPAVFEAVTGVPLGPQELRQTLTGCASPPATIDGRQLGEDWRVISSAAGTPASTLYLRRLRANEWQLVAAVHRDPGGGNGEWRAEFRDFLNGLPRTIRLTSAAAGRFDLRLALSQVEINQPLGSETFRVRVPAESTPITVEELRKAGPLAETSSTTP